MKHFYTVPMALLTANSPSGTWHAIVTPGTPTIALVVVEGWNSPSDQDAWEALEGVNEHYIENFGAVAPPGAITAFAPWGATSGMTLRQLFQLVRARWPACRL